VFSPIPSTSFCKLSDPGDPPQCVFPSDQCQVPRRLRSSLDVRAAGRERRVNKSFFFRRRYGISRTDDGRFRLRALRCSHNSLISRDQTDERLFSIPFKIGGTKECSSLQTRLSQSILLSGRLKRSPFVPRDLRRLRSLARFVRSPLAPYSRWRVLSPPLAVHRVRSVAAPFLSHYSAWVFFPSFPSEVRRTHSVFGRRYRSPTSKVPGFFRRAHFLAR